MTDRPGRAAVLLAAAVAGFLFAPVFGFTPLLLPVGVPVIVLFGVSELCARRPALTAWRPLLLVAAGFLAVIETVLFSTTLAGLPTGETFAALSSGVLGSWRQALQSTWPAWPEPSVLLFVPTLVVLAGVAGLELLNRLRRPLVALVPSAGVVVISQLYTALSGTQAFAAALGYAACAGALCLATRSASDRDEPARDRRSAVSALPVVGLGLVCAILAGALPSAPAYSLKERQAPAVDLRVASPLDEIASRLTHPATPVFDVHAASGTPATDRWPLVVLGNFDGVEWTPGEDYRRFGQGLGPSPAVTVPSHRETAGITMRDAQSPWLPSQTDPASVSGADPLVEETEGSLLTPQPGATTTYTLSWWEPEAEPGDLAAAEIDTDAPEGLGGVGQAPPNIETLADQAVHGLRASFQSALVLERFFRENYRRATGADLPTGHSWAQLSDFLLVSKRGTSEQFAAAYVALARIRGIPARLVVGYRTPAARAADGSYTVRNGDILAWPEVAVTGVGWVALDPIGGTAESGAGSAAGLGALTAQARTQLPAPEQLRDPPVASASPDGTRASAAGGGGWGFLPEIVLAVVGGLAVLWLAGVPLGKALRARRRRSGPAAVVGACHEVRDRLREHRFPLTPGMTVRDLTAIVTDQSTVDGLRELGSVVDRALWSGRPGEHDGADAWASVRAVRRGLARQGFVARMRAALDPRTLLPPRA